MAEIQEKVAVHYNFTAGKLSVRRIHPETGNLTELVDLADEVILRDVACTFDNKRWEAWRAGNKHARQFAEARGYVIKKIPSAKQASQVFLDPRTRAGFFDKQGNLVEHVPYMHLTTKEMHAYL